MNTNVTVNRLAKEKSPYLLQHAHNPVDWYPWGEEAFEEAKRRDKPIFLSIGYSTCHWCHVMEDESFTNPEIASLLNENFVAIKVDREERPDIDDLYMQFVTAMTGSGGWPMTVFLTPDRKPFYGGTYFPPEDRWGRPGVKTVLNLITEQWKNQRDEVLRAGDFLVRAIVRSHEAKGKADEEAVVNEKILDQGYEQLVTAYDREYGGFGGAPKFPNTQMAAFLLRYWKRTGETEALAMAEETLSRMAAGGIYDHLGGGFHRYATDEEWFVPHFEKMLYDQALLSRIYLEAYQATGKIEFAQVAREVFEYVLRDMTSPEGAFYSAEDADSAADPARPHQKSEGVFYLWTQNEIDACLGAEKAAVFEAYYGTQADGNVVQDPQGEFCGKNILHIRHSIEEVARKLDKDPRLVRKILDEVGALLFQARRRRPRPHLDDKVLTDWNALMISSLAFGALVLNEPRYGRAAEKALCFLLKRLVCEDGRLLHRYRDGESAIAGMLEDYAFLIQAFLDVYEFSPAPGSLSKAKELGDKMIEQFWDVKSGGFFSTAHDSEKLLTRWKTVHDGAVPSGNAIAALDLLRLARFFPGTHFEEKASKLFAAFASEVGRSPGASLQILSSLSFALGPSREIIIVEGEDGAAAEMFHLLYRKFIPNKTVILLPQDPTKRKTLIGLAPFLDAYQPQSGKSTAYVCRKYQCHSPTDNLDKFEELLDS
jgi:uncharacterized protein YyaL (SSP411 family)